MKPASGKLTFGERVRELRRSKGWTLRQLAPLVQVGFHYLSKVENGKLDFGDFPSESLIKKLAKVLDGDESELMLLAQKIPDLIRMRVLERPDVFTVLACSDDATLDQVMNMLRTRNAGKAKRGRRR